MLTFWMDLNYLYVDYYGYHFSKKDIKVLNLAEQEKTKTLEIPQLNFTMILINVKPLGNLQYVSQFIPLYPEE